MAKYLITGGAGFIGSHLAETLVAQGQDVVVLDNLVSGKRENLVPASAGPGRLLFIEGDIRDLATCQRAMAGVDYVLHQAARPSVQRSMEDPLQSHDVNLTGTTNLLVAAKDARVKRFVSASSSSVYGDRDDASAPKREDMDPRPMSPYAANKVAMEFYCQAFHRAYGLETVMLRYFNVFGPRQDPESPYAAVIPKFLFALMEGRAPQVHGDGRQSRDFTYIGNVVAANLAACTAPLAPGQAVNVASGHSHDLIELLEILGRLTGQDVRPQFGPPRAGDVRHSLADLTKAQAILGYRLGVGFEQGLAILVDLARQGRYLAS
ncbi:MAG: SDR family oxidoreductase [Desulfarculus sp.]|nr:SDR family oxidoreductase [Desulfarculus sp.]